MAAGLIGMNATTLANFRAAHAGRRSLRKALTGAFIGGSVMGIAVAGLAMARLVFVIRLKAAFAVSAYSAGASLVDIDEPGSGWPWYG